MMSQRNEDVFGENRSCQNWPHKIFKLLFPFISMRRMCESIFFEGIKMSNFMDVSQQELVRVKIGVDGNDLDFAVFAIAEIAQFGGPGFLDFEGEGPFLSKA